MEEPRAAWRSRITGHGEEDPAQLLANPFNFRVHPQAQQEALAAVLDEVGWVDDVMVNQRTGHMIDGHARVELAITREEPTVPVIYVDLSEEEEALVLATFDHTTSLAAVDKGKLDELLREIHTNAPALQKALADMAKKHGLHTGRAQPAGEESAGNANELREKWQTERGQLWIVGQHRLMCGDCTNEDDRARLLEGYDTVDATVTDPPYGLDFDYDGKYGDSREALRELVGGFLPAASKISPVVFITSGNSNMWLYPEPDWTLCWYMAAGAGLGSWGFRCWQPILAYGKDPYLARSLGARPDGVTITQAGADVDHPCPKPERFWDWLVERATPFENMTVFDPFCGSGSTVVSCERLGRIGFGMEIEPSFVAVSLERFAAAGIAPTLAAGRRSKRGRQDGIETAVESPAHS